MKPTQKKFFCGPGLFVVHPMHRQLMLILAGQGTGILRLIDEYRLDELASSIPTEKQGDAVFGSFESRGPLLFLADEGSGRHLLPKQARFISIEDLLRKVPLLFNQLFESLRECCGSVMVRRQPLP